MIDTDTLFLGIVWYGVLLFSLVFHEAAHAWAALRGGDATAYAGGQVSLDPRPHIRREPIGMVVLPILFYATSGFMIGWASTPYDPRWALRHPRRAAWMSAAGPAANALLAIAAGVAIRLALEGGVFQVPELGAAQAAAGAAAHWSWLARFLEIALILNVLLCVFNLIPVPPLDGGTAVGLLLGEDTARRYQLFLMKRPSLAWVGLFAAWYLVGDLFRPALRAVVGVVYWGVA